MKVNWVKAAQSNVLYGQNTYQDTQTHKTANQMQAKQSLQYSLVIYQTKQKIQKLVCISSNVPDPVNENRSLKSFRTFLNFFSSTNQP